MNKIKYLAGGFMALLLLGAGCIVQPEDIGTLEDVNVDNKDDASMQEEKQEVVGMIENTVKVFDMTARQWKFEPATIVVKKGDTVKLNITSVDVSHGFNLPDFGINKRLEPGTTSLITFVADKAGSFGFNCSVLCGAGHSGMTGQLIVQE